MRKILLTILLLTSGLVSAKPLRVLIDPGHGGKDQGAVRGNTIESQIALEVSRELYAMLVKDKRFEAKLSRVGDTWLSLFERAHVAREFKSEVLLSIHVNSSPDHNVRGAEIYFQNQLPPDQHSLYLAHRESHSDDADPRAGPKYPFILARADSQEVKTILQDLLDSRRLITSSKLASSLKETWSGPRANARSAIRQAPFFVLSQLPIPSALVEIGFLSNDQERNQLETPSTRKQMARNLYEGLIKFKESLDK